MPRTAGMAENSEVATAPFIDSGTIGFARIRGWLGGRFLTACVEQEAET